jgi:hypothetical protein
MILAMYGTISRGCYSLIYGAADPLADADARLPAEQLAGAAPESVISSAGADEEDSAFRIVDVTRILNMTEEGLLYAGWADTR